MFNNAVKRALVGAALLAAAWPIEAQYVCLPTCAPRGQTTVDGKFLSLAGSTLKTFNSNDVTVVFGLPVSATHVEFGIFDGDTTGQWESTAGTINLTYTLYEDPLATGTGPVQVAQWIETDFPDNAWFDLSVPVGPGALAPSGTAYFYRLLIEASNAEPLAWTNFKVRTLDTNSLSLQPQAFNFAGARFTAADLAVIYPAWPSLTPTRYDGRWRFFARLGASVDTVRFWDGDLDRGSANCTDNDTDDPDTEGEPFLPPWADDEHGTDNDDTDTAFEGVAVGEPRPCGMTTGSPPDEVDFASYLRAPAVTYTVFVPGDPTPYRNANPSGNLEWEAFTLTTIPGSVPLTADYEVSSLPAGIYQIDMQGMDMRNLNSWFLPEVLGVCERAGEITPFCRRPPLEVGTGTLGYWKNHAEAWPVVATITLGGVTYTKAQAISWMGTATRGNAGIQLFKQLVAAKLNVLNFAESSCIATTISAADAWFATWGPVGTNVTNSAARALATSLQSTLDTYNNGLLCAPHRD